jgi:hypothetical protein
MAVVSTTLLNGSANPTAIENHGAIGIDQSRFDSASANPLADSSSFDIDNFAGATVNVADTTFVHAVGDGGTDAIHNRGNATGDRLVIDHDMGALWNESGGAMQISNTTISNNVYGDIVRNSGNLQMATTTFTGNEPSFNAEIYNNGTSVLVNVTIAGNETAIEDPGAVSAAIDNIGSMTARNLTVTSNVFFGAGGAITGGLANERRGTFKLANTIVAGNLYNDGFGNGTKQGDCLGTFQSLGYNLVQTSTGCTLAGTRTGNIIGKSPELGVLANNGGFTHTRRPLSDSPAIDAGNPAPPGSAPPSLCPQQDQRGVARPRDGNHDGIKRCDIGAVEV